MANSDTESLDRGRWLKAGTAMLIFTIIVSMGVSDALHRYALTKLELTTYTSIITLGLLLVVLAGSEVVKRWVEG